MVTGCLQQKNGYYYAVLYVKVDGKRKTKWIATKLPVDGTSSRKAKTRFDEIREQYERDEAERQEHAIQIELELAEAAKYPPDAKLEFSAYMDKWLNAVRPTIATATYQSYANLIRARVTPYFQPRGIMLKDLAPRTLRTFTRAFWQTDAPPTRSSTTTPSSARHCRPP